MLAADLSVLYESLHQKVALNLFLITLILCDLRLWGFFHLWQY